MRSVDLFRSLTPGREPANMNNRTLRLIPVAGILMGLKITYTLKESR